MTENTTPHNSEEYDQIIIQTIPFYKLFHSETIDIVKTIKPDVKTWLDTGCGTGYLAEQALLTYNGCIFYLADPSLSMLDECKKRLSKIDKNRVVFLNPVNSENLEKEMTQKIDVITSIQCHHYLGYNVRKKAVQSCFNILKNNGLYITFENIKPQSEKGIKASLDRWMRFQIENGRPEHIVQQHRKRFDTKYFPITIHKHFDILKKCGFSTIELFWYSQMQAGFYAVKSKT